MSSGAALLETATDVSAPRGRRDAFLSLLSSDMWSEALQPEILAHQGYLTHDGLVPDLAAARRAADLIADHPDRIERLLETLDDPFSPEILGALADRMGADLLEHALTYLRTASGERAIELMRAVHRADRLWVTDRGARRAVRRLLQSGELYRHRVLNLLVDTGTLADYLDLAVTPPPATLEEWSALGRAKVRDEGLLWLALASFSTSPESLAYLLRLDPVPSVVPARLMAAARPEWMMEAFEVALLEHLDSPVLIPMVQLAVRLGNRPMAMATAWLGSQRLSKELLEHLVSASNGDKYQDTATQLLWRVQQPASSDRALEEGRAGRTPDPNDAAALVRQVHGEDLELLVEEILETPRPTMMESVLRPLCSVNAEAADLVAVMAITRNAGRSALVQRAMAWPDVDWPDLE